MATGVAMATRAGEVRLPITAVVPSTSSPPYQTTVEKGDHLWKISATHLDRYSPDQPVAPYWVEVIEVNTPHLRSGDPDLIYPGEVIELPPFSEQP